MRSLGFTKFGKPSLVSGGTVRRCPISTGAAAHAKRVPKLQEDLNVHDYGKAATDKRRLYVFGLARHGALGLPTLARTSNVKQINRPVRHDIGDIRSVTHAAAGHGFSILAIKPRTGDDNFLVYGTGLNTHSQLGYHAARANAPLEVLIAFVPIQLPVAKKNKVLAVGCGRAHTIVSLEGTGLLTFGDNSFGQCGRRIIQDEAYFGSKYIHHIKGLDQDVVKVISRFDVTYCLLRNGRVLSFGSNLKGQLGRGRKVSKEWEPAYIDDGDLAKQKVLNLSTSGSSAMAVTENGDVFVWGCNEAGNIDPHNPGQVFYEPRHFKLESNVGKVVDAAAGELSSFLVNEKGDVYTWGIGDLMGLGPTLTMLKVPTLMPPPLFGRNEFNPTSRVKRVFCSFIYAAAITTEGNLYTWGKSESGCLGLGPMEQQYFPFKVCLGGRVGDVALGVDHTLVISAGGL